MILEVCRQAKEKNTPVKKFLISHPDIGFGPQEGCRGLGGKPCFFGPGGNTIRNDATMKPRGTIIEKIVGGYEMQLSEFVSFKRLAMTRPLNQCIKTGWPCDSLIQPLTDAATGGLFFELPNL